MAVVEDVADALAGAFGDFAGAFDRADAGVLGTNADTFADVARSVQRVEADEICGSLAGALGDIAGSAAGALADVARAGADVMAGGGWLLLRWWWGCGLLREGREAYDEKSGGEEMGGSHGPVPQAVWMREPGARFGAMRAALSQDEGGGIEGGREDPMDKQRVAGLIDDPVWGQ